MTKPGMFAYPAFVRFWLANAVSTLGTFASGLALQLLLIETMGADQAGLGVVRAAQWLPQLLFGLLAGVIIDRLRRRPILLAADGICAVLLGTIGVLGLTGGLTVPLVAVLVFVVGGASMFFTAAHQAYLPKLVPVGFLPTANARLDQTWTAAQSAGPLIAGALVRFLSAPIAMLVNAATSAVSAVLLFTVRVPETAPPKAADRSILRELREGARWVYRHRTLAPYAISLHIWFFFNSTVGTVLVFFASVDLGLDALTIGALLACSGVSGVVAAGLSPRLGGRFGVGPVCIAGRWLTPIGYLPVLFAQPGAGGVALLVISQLLYGAGLGLDGPLDMSYRNAVTPDRLRGRMNATIRSFNWGTIAVSAPLAGWCAVQFGNKPVIAAAIGGLVVAAVVVTLSPFRSARMPDEDPEDRLTAG